MISSDPALRPALSELSQTLSLQDVLRHLGLDHAAGNLDTASAKAIARNDSPLTLLDHLMREELRVQTERKTQAAIKRSALFPLTTLDGYDFDFPKSIDKDLVMRAASLDFIKERANVVFVGLRLPSTREPRLSWAVCPTVAGCRPPHGCQRQRACRPAPWSCFRGPRACAPELLHLPEGRSNGLRSDATGVPGNQAPDLAELERAGREHPDDLRAHQQPDYKLSRQAKLGEIVALWNRYLARHPKDGRPISSAAAPTSSCARWPRPRPTRPRPATGQLAGWNRRLGSTLIASPNHHVLRAWLRELLLLALEHGLLEDTDEDAIREMSPGKLRRTLQRFAPATLAACKLKPRFCILHDEHAQRGGARAVGASEPHGWPAAPLGAGGREPRNRGGGELGEHRVASG